MILKRGMIPYMKNKRFTFIGMAGVGKSSIGKKIAKILDIPFIDGDTVIETNILMSITDYIKKL